MNFTANPRSSRSLVIGVVLGTFVLMLVSAGLGRADSTPVGPLPAGSVVTTTAKPGLLVAVALPRASRSSGLVWRIARPFNPAIVRQVEEADVGGDVVLIFKLIRRGGTSLVFALTRGDVSPKAVKSATYKIHVL
jgi:hypothetical protein